MFRLDHNIDHPNEGPHIVFRALAMILNLIALIALGVQLHNTGEYHVWAFGTLIPYIILELIVIVAIYMPEFRFAYPLALVIIILELVLCVLSFFSVTDLLKDSGEAIGGHRILNKICAALQVVVVALYLLLGQMMAWRALFKRARDSGAGNARGY